MGNIVWLASYPKSGNTWMRVFLANLIANGVDPVPLDALPRYCEDEARPELFSEIAGQPSHTLDVDEIAALRPRVHAGIAARVQGTRFVKTHNRQGSFEGHSLHDMGVTAGAIYIVRNPLDVVVSMSHHFGIGLDDAVDRLGDARVATGNDELFVTQILGSWSQHVKGWADLAGDKVLVVRYEDLLGRSGKSFAKVARLVGMGQDRPRIERAARHASFPVLAAMERRHGFAEASRDDVRFFRQGRVNQWRDVLSRDQVAHVIGAHREQMARFKYLPAGH
jgi:hypothetical protein